MAVGAIGFEIVCLLLFFYALFGVVEIDRDAAYAAPYGLRATGAVATFGLCALVGPAAAFVALRVGRRWLRERILGAVFIVAVFNGVSFYFVVVLANFLNEVLWNVPFPLGGRYDPR